MDVKGVIHGECVELVDAWINAVEGNLRDLGEEVSGDAVFSELDGIRREIWSRAQEVISGDTRGMVELPPAVLASILLLADAGSNLVATRLIETGRISPDDFSTLNSKDRRKYLEDVEGGV